MDNEKLFILFYIIGMSAVFLPLIFYNAWKLDKEWAKFHPPMTKEDEEEGLKLKAFSCLLDLRSSLGFDYEYNEDQKKLGKSLINDLFKDNENNDEIYELLFNYTPEPIKPAESEADKWIPVSKAVPPKYQWIYVTRYSNPERTDKKVYIMERCRDGYYKFVNNISIEIPENEIIAWMPYVDPEPYKGE